jgi:hypothetical protein
MLDCGIRTLNNIRKTFHCNPHRPSRKKSSDLEAVTMGNQTDRQTKAKEKRRIWDEEEEGKRRLTPDEKRERDCV